MYIISMPSRVHCNPSNLSPLSRVNLHHQVAGSIGSLTAPGKLASGSLLPNVSQLGTKFGVSRAALRELIKMLAAKGLVEVRRNTAARMAADRTTPADLAEMKSAFEGMEGAAKDLGSRIEGYLFFHLALFEGTRSASMTPLGALIQTALRVNFRLTSRDSVAYKRTLALHRAMLGTIKSRTGTKAVLRVLAQTSRDIAAELKKAKKKIPLTTKGDIRASKARTHERH